MALPYPHFPPLWREGRMALEWAVLRTSDVLRGAGVPPGDGRGVLLIPGFLAGDGSLAVMTHWLRDAGYRTKAAGIRANVNCSGAACRRIEERLESLAATHGRPRRRSSARAAAACWPRRSRRSGRISCPASSRSARRCARSSRCTRWCSPRSASSGPWVRGGCRACSPGAVSAAPAARSFREALAGPFPDEVGYVSLYSRSDGVVDWRSCLDPAAECIEVDASHCGMSLNVAAYHAIARSLRAFQGARGRGLAAGRLIYARSSSATHSMCGVCGNMSTGRTRTSV